VDFGSIIFSGENRFGPTKPLGKREARARVKRRRFDPFGEVFASGSMGPETRLYLGKVMLD
jgi:hypothetical protein